MAELSPTSATPKRKHSNPCQATQGDTLTDSQACTSTPPDDFDWHNLCFVCCMPCHKSNKRSKKNSWSNVEQNCVYEKVLTAAENKNDVIMLDRLSKAKGDLVDVGARYHYSKSCLTNYLKRKREHGQPDYLEREREDGQISCTQSLSRLIKTVEPSVANKQIYSLSNLSAKYNEFAKENSEPSLSPHRLKVKLQKHTDWQIFHQPGRSDLICDKHMNIHEAVRQAHVSVLQEEEEESMYTSKPCANEQQTLHAAAGILRNQLKRTPKLAGEFFSSDEMSKEACKSFVDPMLLSFLTWLTNEEHFLDATTPTDINTQTLSIACDITTSATKINSPKHLGLTVHCYKEHGSRTLIEELHNLGHGVSYDELRHFLTSSAAHVSCNQPTLPFGGLIPSNVPPKANTNNILVAIADNWDHNEKTVSGKGTTHAMTSILVSNTAADAVPASRVKKCGDRALDMKTIPGGYFYVNII